MKKEDYQKLERIYKKFVLYANHFCLEDTILKSEINLFNKYIPNNIKSVDAFTSFNLDLPIKYLVPGYFKQQ